MASSQESSCFYNMIIIVFLTTVACSSLFSDAYQFIVGGKDGWTLNPKEQHNHWAERMRFQVNDTLLFKYKKGLDSVLVVNKTEYEQCNTDDRSITKLEGGDSIFEFDHSGPFYFISGNKSNCHNGQKLIIVVMAVRNGPEQTVSSSPAPAPHQHAIIDPSPSPVADAPEDQNPTPNNNQTQEEQQQQHKRSFGIRDRIVSSTLFVVIITSTVLFALTV